MRFGISDRVDVLEEEVVEAPPDHPDSQAGEGEENGRKARNPSRRKMLNPPSKVRGKKHGLTRPGNRYSKTQKKG
jgi:hypothetical protein